MGRVVSTNAADAKSVEEGGGFKPWPAGNYIGEIIDVKDTKFAKTGDNASLDAINVTFRFTESNTGKGVGKKFIAWRVPLFSNYLSGEKKPAPQFYQFFKAAGVEGLGDGDVELPDNEDLIGLEIGVALKIEPDNKDQPRNVVRDFFPASKGVGDSVAADDAEDEGDDFAL